MVFKLCALSVFTLATLATTAQRPVPRPRIVGISDAGFYTSNLPKTIAFWHDFLGYDDAYDVPKKDSAETRIAFIKINDHEHIELLNESPAVPRNMFAHLRFRVDSVAQMYAFLRSRGYDVKDSAKTVSGDEALEVKDPDGTVIQFVEARPTGMEAKDIGKHLPESRIAPGIYHVGFTVGDSQKSLAFYSMLGFTETWRGSPDTTELRWINLKVPDGTDYIEFMLYHGVSDPNTWGGKNHISLVVPDIEKAVAVLTARAATVGYTRPLKFNTGVNGKRLVNLFDPDGTRVELMEANTADGKPVPSSKAPPPVPATRP